MIKYCLFHEKYIFSVEHKCLFHAKWAVVDHSQKLIHNIYDLVLREFVPMK